MKLKDKKIMASVAKKLFLFFFGIILIFLFEGVAAFFLPDSKLNIAESLSVICREDPLMFWSQRSCLKMKFYGEDVRTNNIGLRGKDFPIEKKYEVNRIICMGASSTFGWGVAEDQTYPFLLEKIFAKNKKSALTEVLNAGQIGFTTFQGKIFLKKHILNYSPDIITVSYILNDIDRCRFVRNEKKYDSELTPSAAWKIIFKNIAIKSRIYLMGKRFLSKVASKNEKFLTYVLRRQYENTKTRVSPQQYHDNLSEIAGICKAKNIKLIFLKMPVHLMRPKLTEGEEALMKNGVLLSDSFYNRACSFQARGEYSKAIADFQRARDYQVIECQRDGEFYQRIMSKAAREQGIVIIDIAKLFKAGNDMALLFNGPQDPIHPSGIGHEIIAKALYKSIKENNFISGNLNR